MSELKLKPKLVDSPSVIETYSNKLISTSFDGGAIVVALGVTRFMPQRIDDAPRQGEDPVVGVSSRFAISPACAIELINSLNQMLGTIAVHSNPRGAPVKAPPPKAAH